MTTQAEYYSSTSRKFLAQAEASLALDDLLQASEKGWGAAAEMVKGIAHARGWPHNGHRELFRIIDRLAEESGDEQLLTFFSTASALHVNFYEGWMTRNTVAVDLRQVAELLRKLEVSLA